MEASTVASSMFTTSSMYGGNVPQSRPAGARTNPLGEVKVGDGDHLVYLQVNLWFKILA